MKINLQVGPSATWRLLRPDYEQRRQLLDSIVTNNLDHVFMADHVSFHTGTGMDGLTNAAMITAMNPQLQACVGVYLLALRHPLPVARQIATICEAAPGRLTFGVGVGGEDRHEFEICGVDPKTRGRRTDESLSVLRPLLRGETVSHDGEFFQFEEALIVPAPNPPVPIIIGGRSNAAVRRTAQYGDGWLGVWCSPTRYAQVLEQIAEQADKFGRQDTDWRHGLQIWVGYDPDRKAARARLAKNMEEFYRTPFEKFEKYSPYGDVQEIADFLAGYVEVGCQLLNVMVVSGDEAAGIEALGKIKQQLLDTFST